MMPSLTKLESILKFSTLLSAIIMAGSYYVKDRLPEPRFYQSSKLSAPRQTLTSEQPFDISVSGQHYTITPKFDYALDGVVVSLNNAHQLGNIWHHRRWKDFINLRDLCVVWGENVHTGIYKQVQYRSDSWTCWVSWQTREQGERFSMVSLSNNHLLTDDITIKRALMTAEVGDLVHFEGYLAQYENKGNGFVRGTSVRRDDRGNGACETVYLTHFLIHKKANAGLRRIYKISKWWFIVSALGFVFLFLIAPFRQRK